MSELNRNSITMRVSEDWLAHTSGFQRRGHFEPVKPTPEQVAEHKRATDLLRELNENQYLDISGYDYDITVRPLETERWVADETDAEFIARWKAAGSPVTGGLLPHGVLAEVVQSALTRGVDWTALLGDTPDK